MEKNIYLSVIMAEYNTEPAQLQKSIESILNQTYEFFELIIVDDCGKNDVEKIVKQFDDSRIKVIKNKENIGLAQSLNKGVENAKYDYIIRMDTDDICYPNRFEKQITFALKHPEYSIIGGNHVYFDEEGEYPSYFGFHGEVNKNNFLYSTPFSHPTLLLKKKDLINSGGYPNYRRGQDYAMEMQMYVNGYKGFVMEDILIKYRQDMNGYKKKNYKSRILEYKIRKRYFKQLKLPWYRIFFIIKPLLAGIVPKKMLKKYHETNMKDMKILKLLEIVKHPSYLLVYLNNKGIHLVNKDETYLQILYKLRLEKKLDLKNPKTFNEKLQWLKLYDRKNIYTNMVDKNECKKYVSDVIGKEYIIPTLGVWKRFEDIEFEKLPKQFVLKCTHDSGGIIICKNKEKFNIDSNRKKFKKYLKRNYYYYGREWPYKNIEPRIIAENYMEDTKTKELRDYKFLCFNGEPKIMFVATDRNKHETKFNYYDMDFNLLHMKQSYPNDNRKIDKPKGFEKMKELARKLSNGIPHVRVDFYEINGKIYFGEMTFYHYSGLVPFHPEDWDYKLGKLIDLSLVNKSEK